MKVRPGGEMRGSFIATDKGLMGWRNAGNVTYVASISTRSRHCIRISEK